MPPEFWLVLIVAGAFLLLGIAGSPLAWALVYQRRTQSEELMERTWKKVADELRALETRLTDLETSNPAQSRSAPLVQTKTVTSPDEARFADEFGRSERGVSNLAPKDLIRGTHARSSRRTTQANVDRGTQSRGNAQRSRSYRQRTKRTLFGHLDPGGYGSRQTWSPGPPGNPLARSNSFSA